MKKQIYDERIELQKKNIYSKASIILITSLIIDFIYKIFLDKKSIFQCMDIIIILLITSIYITIHLIKNGLYNINVKEKIINLKIIIFSSVLSSIIFSIGIIIAEKLNILNNPKDLNKLLVSVISFFIVITLIQYIFSRFSNRKD